MVTDPISDMLTRVRNALMLRKDSVEVPHSKIKKEVSRVLKENGYITDFFEVSDDKFKKIKLVLKYHDGRSVIHGLKRVSTPGRRVYVGTQEVPRVMGGMGVAVVSTSRGILTGHQARRLKVGGELLCYVW